jgi:ribosome-associated protein
MSDPMAHDHLDQRALPADSEIDGLEFARQIARIADQCKAQNVAVLDLRGLSSIADFFVIGTGTSDRQMHAAADQIRSYARTVGRKPYRVADSASSSWILADFVDVMLHLFDETHRDFYDLEGIWGDAPRIGWRAETPE